MKALLLGIFLAGILPALDFLFNGEAEAGSVGRCEIALPVQVFVLQ